MRAKVRMIFLKNSKKQGYMNHWGMNYFVTDIVDIQTGKQIVDNYIFTQSTIFKGKGFKPGDVIEMSITIKENNGKFKFLYPRDIRKI